MGVPEVRVPKRGPMELRTREVCAAKARAAEASRGVDPSRDERIVTLLAKRPPAGQRGDDRDGGNQEPAAGLLAQKTATQRGHVKEPRYRRPRGDACDDRHR